MKRTFFFGAFVFVVSGLFLSLASEKQCGKDVAETKKLYAEFLQFKDKPEFRRVGFGACCEYHAWMKKVAEIQDRVQGACLAYFDRHFGVFPGDLIVLGREYISGRENGETAQFFETRIELAENPVKRAPKLKTTHEKANKTIGTWLNNYAGIAERIKISTRGDGKFILVSEFSDGSSTSDRLVEVAPQRGQLRQFRGAAGSATYHHQESYAILSDGRLGIYDPYGLISIAEVQR